MLILLAINVSPHETKCVNDDHTHGDYILNKMYTQVNIVISKTSTTNIIP